MYADLCKDLLEALLSLDDGFADPSEVEILPLVKLRSKGEDAATYSLNGEEPGKILMWQIIQLIFTSFYSTHVNWH